MAQWACVSEQQEIGTAGCCQTEPDCFSILKDSVMLQSWLLLSLLGDDGGIGAEGLAQQLVRLLDAASHDPAGKMQQLLIQLPEKQTCTWFGHVLQPPAAAAAADPCELHLVPMCVHRTRTVL